LRPDPSQRETRGERRWQIVGLVLMFGGFGAGIVSDGSDFWPMVIGLGGIALIAIAEALHTRRSEKPFREWLAARSSPRNERQEIAVDGREERRQEPLSPTQPLLPRRTRRGQ
jgi:hypothetical protein